MTVTTTPDARREDSAGTAGDLVVGVHADARLRGTETALVAAEVNVSRSVHAAGVTLRADAVRQGRQGHGLPCPFLFMRSSVGATSRQDLVAGGGGDADLSDHDGPGAVGQRDGLGGAAPAASARVSVEITVSPAPATS